MDSRNPRGFELSFRNKRVLFLVFLEVDVFYFLTLSHPASGELVMFSWANGVQVICFSKKKTNEKKQPW